ncbi:MAG: DUF4493 domain-containing protein [Bacteroidales bacterium]|nr:DUF4493 domain-containing protein [Bacteroidales bacterium]
MRRFVKGLSAAAALPMMVIAAITMASCSKNPSISSTISLSLSHEWKSSAPLLSKAAEGEIPDTNSLILKVVSENGDLVWQGLWAERSPQLKVSPGTYKIDVYSDEFSTPAFSCPVYGDSRTVFVGATESVSVSLRCTQTNSGVRISCDQNFIERFGEGCIGVCSGTDTLNYHYQESRIGYFLPGRANFIHRSTGGTATILLGRNLEAATILTLKLSASVSETAGFKVSIDTTRCWVSESFCVGSGNDGSSAASALQVADLPMYSGAKDIWVAGYICGGDCTTANVVTTPPFSKNSHIAISDSEVPPSRNACAAVELPTGDTRNALNLVDNPGLLGRRIAVCGTVTDYFGYPGLKSVKAYQFL